MAARVRINENEYVLRGDISAIPLDEFPRQQTQTSTQQSRNTRVGYSTYVMDDARFGLGLRRIDSRYPEQFMFLADSDASTRFGFTTLTHLMEKTYFDEIPTTGPATVKPIACAPNLSSTTTKTAVIITEGGTADGTSIGIDGITVERNAVANVAHTYTGMNYAHWTDGEVLYCYGAVVVKTNGSDTLTQEALTGPTAARVIATYGNNSYIVESDGDVWRDAAGYTDYGVSAITTISPGAGIVDAIGFPDEATGEAILVFTRDDVHLVDSAGNASFAYGHGESSMWNGHNPTYWGGYVWFPSGEDVVAMRWEAGVLASYIVGPNSHIRRTIVGEIPRIFGLPSYRRGQVTALASSTKWLWVAMGGNSSSSYATVMAYDGVHWSTEYIHPTANVIISGLCIVSDASGNPANLVMATYTSHDMQAAPTTNAPVYVAKRILHNQMLDTAVKCKETGYIAYPDYDMNLAEVNGGLFHLFIGGEGWSASKTVRPYYALNGATVGAPQTQGNYTALAAAQTSENVTLDFESAASRADGIAARTVQMRLDLANGSTHSWAADTGASGTGANDSLEGGTVDWVNPTNVATNDASYTTSTAGGGGGTSRTLTVSNWGFAVPTAATITGVLVEFEAKSTVGTVTHNSIKLRKTAASVGTSQHASLTAITTSDQVLYTGGANNLWGTTWTAAEINASTFGVMFFVDLAANAVCHIDYMKVYVYYTNHTGTDTATPVVNTAELLYRKKPPTRYADLMTVDIAASSAGGTRNAETVRTELETIMDSNVAIRVQYGKVDKYMLPVPFDRATIRERVGGSTNLGDMRRGEFPILLEDT